MRNFFLSLMVLSIPVLVSAQQKSASQDQLRKEMEQMKSEMQAKMRALQDSIALLEKELSARDAERNAETLFRLFPSQEEDTTWNNLFKERDWSYGYQFRIPDIQIMPAVPPAEPFEFYYEMPRIPEIHAKPYSFYFSIPDEKKLERKYKYRVNVPPCPEERQHKHEWMKGLPFYNWFAK